ncbi:GTP-binding protein [Leucobacter sp. UCD-THU]|uniref:GTPase HflX n=1 Tax=Leucobacter sp. UCD-THU TaxID=1292023 RepID=UPI00037F3957|nr:GTPase HflX [Leucobacter sp. UCD-THU]EYT53163.1 GTP-binding protein [Leucobacter sp. UCD-THU]
MTERFTEESDLALDDVVVNGEAGRGAKSAQRSDRADSANAASQADASEAPAAGDEPGASAARSGADSGTPDDDSHAADSADPLERLLARAARGGSATVIRDAAARSGGLGVDNLTGGAQALGDEVHDRLAEDLELIRLEREERASLTRVAGLSTELEDVTEVEYRQLRLENAVLIGVYTGSARHGLEEAENSLRELAALAETAGARVLDGLLQRRAHPDPATYLGKGKAQELAELVAAVGADTVVADTELAPSQRRALEDVVKVKVIDRTAVILDIFSQHAKSREGKAQVELAQLEYLLPRLRGWGESMSRQAGGQVGSGGAGMGSRGPGETKMELDRRKIHTRMAKLRKQIAGFAPARDAKRANRKRGEVPSVAIAGYTNAGKSSLLNRLTGTQELVQNQLFATLDTAVRHAETADGRRFTYADTVGFVRNLPHQLVEAFRSTFEEVGEADVILHVVDGSHPDPAAQLRTVRDVIAEVDAQGIPEIVAFNKADLLDESQRLVLHGLAPDAVFVSARTGEGVEELRRRIDAALPVPDREVTVVVPYDRGELVAELHERNRVLSTEYVEQGTRVRAYVTGEMLAKLDPYLA